MFVFEAFLKIIPPTADDAVPSVSDDAAVNVPVVPCTAPELVMAPAFHIPEVIVPTVTILELPATGEKLPHDNIPVPPASISA